jgi:hypothetical protein
MKRVINHKAGLRRIKEKIRKVVRRGSSKVSLSSAVGLVQEGIEIEVISSKIRGSHSRRACHKKLLPKMRLPPRQNRGPDPETDKGLNLPGNPVNLLLSL